MNSLRPESRLTWHGVWPAGRIEPNRLLYDYELIYVSGGKGYVAAGGESYYCEAGSLLIIPPRLLHFTRAGTRIERWCIHFDWHGECLAQKELGLPYIFPDDGTLYQEELTAKPPPELDLKFPLHLRLGAEAQSEFLALLRKFFSEADDTLAASFRRHAMLWEILAFALETPSGEEKRRNVNSLFFQAKGILDREFRDPDLEVGEIARSLAVTPNHLLKLFRRETGMTTQNYLTLRRLQHAEKLLARTRLSIAEIANLSGFTTPNYFSRLFRLRHAQSPREFRAP